MPPSWPTRSTTTTRLRPPRLSPPRLRLRPRRNIRRNSPACARSAGRPNVGRGEVPLPRPLPSAHSAKKKGRQPSTKSRMARALNFLKTCRCILKHTWMHTRICVVEILTKVQRCGFEPHQRPQINKQYWYISVPVFFYPKQKN